MMEVAGRGKGKAEIAVEFKRLHIRRKYKKKEAK
jgi:hypothetical protein